MITCAPEQAQARKTSMLVALMSPPDNPRLQLRDGLKIRKPHFARGCRRRLTIAKQNVRPDTEDRQQQCQSRNGNADVARQQPAVPEPLAPSSKDAKLQMRRRSRRLPLAQQIVQFVVIQWFHVVFTLLRFVARRGARILRKFSRARCNRVLTVPTSASTTRAICSSASSSYSNRISASR